MRILVPADPMPPTSIGTKARYLAPPAESPDTASGKSGVPAPRGDDRGGQGADSEGREDGPPALAQMGKRPRRGRVGAVQPGAHDEPRGPREGVREGAPRRGDREDLVHDRGTGVLEADRLVRDANLGPQARERECWDQSWREGALGERLWDGGDEPPPRDRVRPPGMASCGAVDPRGKRTGDQVVREVWFSAGGRGTRGRLLQRRGPPRRFCGGGGGGFGGGKRPGGAPPPPPGFSGAPPGAVGRFPGWTLFGGRQGHCAPRCN